VSLIAFTVPGDPVGKARPRFARIGAFVRTYTPKTTASYENLVKVMFCQASGPAYAPTTGPVVLTVRAIFSRPASHYGTGRNAGQLKNSSPLYYTHKPDVDNVAKTVLDALNGLAYQDDRQVCRVGVTKEWGQAGEMRVELEAT
jgi:Holliday junction resolvase RusA-like endonuclease